MQLARFFLSTNTHVVIYFKRSVFAIPSFFLFDFLWILRFFSNFFASVLGNCVTVLVIANCVIFPSICLFFFLSNTCDTINVLSENLFKYQLTYLNRV